MKTMFDPVATGLYEIGDVARQIVADEQGPKHCLIQGMTGSGKTDGEKPVILAMAARGAVQVIIDVRKKTQSYGSLAPVLDWLIVDEGTAHAALELLIDSVIPARTAFLAQGGFGSWHPKSGMQFLRVQIEEAWDFVDSDDLTAASLAARSAGVQLVVSLQRASHDLISTSLRDQLGTVKCYGLKSSWGASILDDDVVDAGANPQKWSDEFPGMHYMQQGGLTIAQKATPIRAYTDSGREKYAASALALKDRIAPCDETTRNAWGDLWFKRKKPMELTAAIRPVAMTKPIAAVPAAVIEENDEEENDDMHVIDDTTGAQLGGDGTTVTFTGDGRGGDKLRLDEPDPEPGFTPDADAPIADRDPERAAVQLGDGTPKASREQYDVAMNARLSELIDSGARTITAVDFADVLVTTGWSRGTVYRMLREWVAMKQLARTDDGWVPVREP